MTTSLLFWILMLLYAVLEVTSKPLDFKSHKSGVVLFVAIVLLGYKVMGPVLRD